MFSLLVRVRRNPRFIGFVIVPMWCVMFSAFGIGLFITAALAGAALAIAWSRWRHRKPRWVLFTDEGIGSRHDEGRFIIIPWSEFSRVTFLPAFDRRRAVDGRKMWRLRLYREPAAALYNREHNRGRGTIRDVIADVQATEAQASIIVDVLRRRFLQGWQGAEVQTSA